MAEVFLYAVWRDRIYSVFVGDSLFGRPIAFFCRHLRAYFHVRGVRSQLFLYFVAYNGVVGRSTFLHGIRDFRDEDLVPNARIYVRQLSVRDQIFPSLLGDGPIHLLYRPRYFR